MLTAEPLVLGAEARHDRREDQPLDPVPVEAAELQRPGEGERQLVGGGVAAGGQAPVADQLGAVEGTDVGLGVADVDGEKHRAIVATAADRMRVGSPAVKARLFTIPASHPGWTARLMLERKGIPYCADRPRRDRFDTGRARARFPADAVRAADLRRKEDPGLAGDRPRARPLVPEPPLLPADPTERERVEEAEAWGDEVLAGGLPGGWRGTCLAKDSGQVAELSRGLELGVPLAVAEKTAPRSPSSQPASTGPTSAAIADLAALPGLIDRIDGYVADGVVGGDPPNAADLQIGAEHRSADDDGGPAAFIADRPAGDLARRLVPDFPGHVPASFPSAWLEPLSA